MQVTGWTRGLTGSRLVVAVRLALVPVLATIVGLGISGDAPVAAPRVYHAQAETSVRSFHSQPDLHPPTLTVGPSLAGPAGRYVFLAPWRGDGQAGLMILDRRGRLVWFHPLPEDHMAMNLQVQRYHGQRVLTWWQGVLAEGGYGKGEYVVANSSYHPIARFRPGGLPGDMHEFQITPRGTALVTVYQKIPYDLSPVGGPKHGTLLDSMVEEVDIATGKVLFQWRASDHIPLTASHQVISDDPDDLIASAPDEPYDFAHLNSVDIDLDGNLLISARHTDTIYKVDRDTGDIIWRLGGKNSDFTLPPDARFGSQHDVRRHRDGTITMFDNSDPPQVRDQSRVLRLRLHLNTMRATVVEQREHPGGVLTRSQGNAQLLPNGGYFVAWGSDPHISRFGPDGHLLFDGYFPDHTNNYRAFLEPWEGHPRSRPALDVEAQDDASVTVYASWNGATRVDSWQVLAGTDKQHLHPVRSTPWTGFETPIAVSTHAQYVAVRAVSRSGQPLACSLAVPVP